MALNNIQLSDHLLTALYARTLVTEMGSLTASAETIPIQYLGKNLKNFVVLVNHPDQVHLPGDSLNFLTTVLKACQLTIADVAIINLAKQQCSATEIIRQFSPLQVIDFGSSQQFHEWQLPQPLKATVIGNYQLMLAPSIERLNLGGDGVKPLKKQMWEELKRMLQQ